MLPSLRIRLPTESEADFIERYRAHLSRGGIFIATRSPKPVGSELAFELVLQSGLRVLRGEGVVLKVRGEGESAPPGMMLRFRKLDSRSKALVERLAAERAAARSGQELELPTEIEVQLEFTGEHTAPDAAFEVRPPAESGAGTAHEMPGAGAYEAADATESQPTAGAGAYEGADATESQPTAGAGAYEGADATESHPTAGAGAYVGADATESQPTVAAEAYEGADATGAEQAEAERYEPTDSHALSEAHEPPLIGPEPTTASGPGPLPWAEAEQGSEGEATPLLEQEPKTASGTLPWAERSPGAALERPRPIETTTVLERPRPIEATTVVVPPPTPEGAPPLEPAAAAPAEARPRRRISLEVPAAEAPPVARRGVGIQVGAFQTRAAVVGGEPVAVASALTQGPGGELLVGALAVDAGNPWFGWSRGLGLLADTPMAQKLFDQSPFPFTADSRGQVAWQIGERVVSAQEATTELLRGLYATLQAQLGGSPLAAVLCAPSHFTHRQRIALKMAAEAAGFRVLRLLQTTSGAALAVGHGRGLPRRRVLVCDLDAGGTDAAVVELTGNDIESVTSLGDATVGGLELTEQGFQEYADAALGLTQAVLGEAGLQPQGLDEVVLAGSHSQGPQIRQHWESALGKAPLEDTESEGLAARGAALLAHSLTAEGMGPPFATAAEVLTCGLEVVLEGLGSQRLFERRTHLPAEKTLEVKGETGKPIRAAVFQRRGQDAPELVGLVTFQPERRGTFNLRFFLDSSALLQISITPPAMAPPQPITLEPATAAPPELLPTERGPDTEPTERGGLFRGLKRLLKRG